MATLSLLSTLQQAPYFDDYDETKKFLRMLFKPSVSVQVRELIQLQTILQNQISRFGDAFYKDGSLVTGGQISLDTNVHFIRVATNTTLANFVNQKIQILNQSTITADVIATVAAPTVVKEPEKPAEAAEGETNEGAEAAAEGGDKTSTDGDKAEGDKSKEVDKPSADKK